MRAGEQINFRLREDMDKEAFTRTLETKQKHIPNQTALFQGVMDAVQKASKAGRLIEWPIELVLKPKK